MCLEISFFILHSFIFLVDSSIQTHTQEKKMFYYLFCYAGINANKKHNNEKKEVEKKMLKWKETKRKHTFRAGDRNIAFLCSVFFLSCKLEGVGSFKGLKRLSSHFKGVFFKVIDVITSVSRNTNQFEMFMLGGWVGCLFYVGVHWKGNESRWKRRDRERERVVLEVLFFIGKRYKKIEKDSSSSTPYNWIYNIFNLQQSVGIKFHRFFSISLHRRLFRFDSIPIRSRWLSYVSRSFVSYISYISYISNKWKKNFSIYFHFFYSILSKSRKDSDLCFPVWQKKTFSRKKNTRRKHHSMSPVLDCRM